MANIKRKLLVTLIFNFSFIIVMNFITIAHAKNVLPDKIKIGLYFASTAVSSIEVSSENGLDIGYDKDGQFHSLTTHDSSDKIIISKDAGENNTEELNTNSVGVTVEGEETPLIIFDSDEHFLFIKPLSNNAKDSVISINGIEYRGGVEIKRINQSDMTVINVVDIEQYLYSVLPKEMSWNWPAEALKAQSVAARTYAILHMKKYEKYGFNLCATTSSQVYGGYKVEHINCTQAVEETKGKILTYNGKPASIYYFSSSGGYTEDIRNVWGGQVQPYLMGVEDPYEPTEKAGKGIWTIELPTHEIQQMLKTSGYDLGDITSIMPIEYSNSGRVIKLKVRGTNGEQVLENQNTRTAFGSSIIYSQKYNITTDSDIYVIGDNSQAPLRTLAGELKVLSGKQRQPIYVNMNTLNVKGSQTEKSYNTVPGSYIFDGRGYGHGIGMSQWGAYGMAEAGFDYSDILTHYFPGTAIN